MNRTCGSSPVFSTFWIIGFLHRRGHDYHSVQELTLSNLPHLDYHSVKILTLSNFHHLAIGVAARLRALLNRAQQGHRSSVQCTATVEMLKTFESLGLPLRLDKIFR